MRNISKLSILMLLILLGWVTPYTASAAPTSKPKNETVSQESLRKVMEAIRNCDKSEIYEYDLKAKRISPSWLKKIKGLHFVRKTYGFAVFRIDEMYEGMHARFLWMRVAGTGNGNVQAVAFDGAYQVVRQQFEELWNVRFNEIDPIDMPSFDENQYGTVELMVDGKRRWLSVGVPVEFPPITIPEVGCKAWEN